MKKLSLFKKLTIFISFFIISGCSTSKEIQQGNSSNNSGYSWLNLDTVKAGRFDTGKMWTLEYPPLEYFKEEYNFTPGVNWFNNVKMSTLRFAAYCSASFISEDGLVMTNNHCARESAVEVSEEGEDLHINGFYAGTLEDERRVPSLFVDQLVLIKDVTEEIQSAIEKDTTDEDKILNEETAIIEIEAQESDITGLIVSVTPLYNGGKYSLYGYKRYEDVRLVFTPEHLLGHFGGDFDNFTYPRYNLDAAFFRVYDENGEPLKTENYFKWSENGAEPGEAVFVVGNPGSTNRLKTVAQLEYLRDITYPRTLSLYKDLADSYAQLMEDSLEEKDVLEVQYLRYLNSIKAYEGMLEGLRDPVLMQKKRDFENTFKQKIISDAELKEEYSSLWENIENVQERSREISNELFALSVNPAISSDYFLIAFDLINLAFELQLPDSQRSDAYKEEELQNTIDSMMPEAMNNDYNKDLLIIKLKALIDYLGYDNKMVEKLTGGRDAEEAADYILKNSSLTSEEKIRGLIEEGPDAILNSDDPLIYFVLNAEDRKTNLQNEYNKLVSLESSYDQLLGKALFEVYGTSIPPDATFTLRISDGIIKGFPYNGTIAPPITTYFGLYDRYYSFGKEYPWDLPEKWLTPPAEFDLKTPFNFVSTNDITGGNSGSPVINKDAEIVGVAFDGNIQSLPGSFIFTTEANRTVSVHSEGIIEAVSDLYKADRLADELKNGKIIYEPDFSSEKE